MCSSLLDLVRRGQKDRILGRVPGEGPFFLGEEVGDNLLACFFSSSFLNFSSVIILQSIGH